MKRSQNPTCNSTITRYCKINEKKGIKQKRKEKDLRRINSRRQTQTVSEVDEKESIKGKKNIIKDPINLN